MSPRYCLAFACIALLSGGLAAQVPQQAQEDEFLKPQASNQKTKDDEDFLKDVYVIPGTPGMSLPQVVKEVRPAYTPEAMRQKIQGSVELQVVIGVDGTVVRGRVTKSLDKDYGLDASALESALQWKFKPAMLNGSAVPVAVNLLLEYRLRR